MRKRTNPVDFTVNIAPANQHIVPRPNMLRRRGCQIVSQRADEDVRVVLFDVFSDGVQKGNERPALATFVFGDGLTVVAFAVRAIDIALRDPIRFRRRDAGSGRVGTVGFDELAQLRDRQTQHIRMRQTELPRPAGGEGWNAFAIH